MNNSLLKIFMTSLLLCSFIQGLSAQILEDENESSDSEPMHSPLLMETVQRPIDVAWTIIEECDDQNQNLSSTCMMHRHWIRSSFDVERSIRKTVFNDISTCHVTDLVKTNEKQKTVKFTLPCHQLKAVPKISWLRSLEPWLGKIIDPNQP